MKKFRFLKFVLLIIMCCTMLVNIPVSAASASQEKYTKLITEKYNNILYLNKQYIVLGSIGDVKDEGRTNFVKVSKDFKTWKTYDLGKNMYFESMIYAKGSYWALSGTKDLYASKDLKTWKCVGKPNSQGGKLIYTGKKFFIIGLQCYSSDDGYKWKKSNYTVPVDTPEISGIEYTQGKGFLVIGRDIYSGKTFSLTSKDGVKWKNNKNNLSMPSHLMWDGKEYLVLSSKELMASKNGIDWEVKYRFNKNTSVSFARYLNGKYITKRDDDIHVSGNFTDWDSKNYMENMDMRNVIWDGKKYCSVGVHGEMMTSTDGLNWEQINISNELMLNKVIWNGKQYIAVGDDNSVAMSKDGVNWTYKHLNIDVPSKNGTFDIISVTSDGNKYAVLVEYVEKYANDVALFLSDDFETWKKAEYKEFSYSPLEDIVYDGKNYIAVGGNSFISTDGINWTGIKPMLKGAKSIVSAGGKYVVVGSQNSVAVSTDGTQWTQTDVKDINYLDNISYDGKQYVAIDYRGGIYTSKDGSTWKSDFNLLPDKKDKYANVISTAYNGSHSVALVEYNNLTHIYFGTPKTEKVKTIKDSYIKAVIKKK